MVTAKWLEEVASGDRDAWHRLWSWAAPIVGGVARSPRALGRLAKEEDEREDVIVRVMHRIQENDFARLRHFLSDAGERAASAFRPWLVVVTTRVAIDHLRSHERYVGAGDGASRWHELESLDPLAADSPDSGANPEEHATAQAALDYARRILDADQNRALIAWLEGKSADEIAAALSLDDRETATRLVRSALKRLRDRYREVPAARAMTAGTGRTLQ